VKAMMEALYAELERTMSITGCGSVEGIDPSILHPVEIPAVIGR
jgi:isopentenyl diphosphate isomerase/L-lactate dehydrogenase-like FMN-dependent dehydrogenase